MLAAMQSRLQGVCGDPANTLANSLPKAENLTAGFTP